MYSGQRRKIYNELRGVLKFFPVFADKKVMDKNHKLNLLKETLEDIDLFLKEIESVVEILNNTTDEAEREACEYRLLGLQQHITNISSKLEKEIYKNDIEGQ